MIVLITSTIILAVLGIYKYYDIIGSYVSDVYKHYVGSNAASNFKSSNMYTDTVKNMNNSTNINGQPIINNTIPTNNTHILINNTDTLIDNNCTFFASDLIQKGVSTFTESSKMANESILPLVNNTKTFENITNATNSTAFKNFNDYLSPLNEYLYQIVIYSSLIIVTILIVYLFYLLYKFISEDVLNGNDDQYNIFSNNIEFSNSSSKGPLLTKMIISAESNLNIPSVNLKNDLNQIHDDMNQEYTKFEKDNNELIINQMHDDMNQTLVNFEKDNKELILNQMHDNMNQASVKLENDNKELILNQMHDDMNQTSVKLENDNNELIVINQPNNMFSPNSENTYLFSSVNASDIKI